MKGYLNNSLAQWEYFSKTIQLNLFRGHYRIGETYTCLADHRRNGYAKIAVLVLINRMLEAGMTPELEITTMHWGLTTIYSQLFTLMYGFSGIEVIVKPRHE